MKLQNIQSGPEVAQSGPEKKRRAGKTHADYWAPRLVKRSYTWDDKPTEVPEWYVRIAHLGRRGWFKGR